MCPHTRPTSNNNTNTPLYRAVLQVPEVQHQTEEQRTRLLAEHPLSRLYQLKRKCNGCQEQDLSLLEGELVALLEDTDPLGSSSRWLVDTGGKCVCVRVCVCVCVQKDKGPLRPEVAPGALCLSDTQSELSHHIRSSSAGMVGIGLLLYTFLCEYTCIYYTTEAV